MVRAKQYWQVRYWIVLYSRNFYLKVLQVASLSIIITKWKQNTTTALWAQWYANHQPNIRVRFWALHPMAEGWVHRSCLNSRGACRYLVTEHDQMTTSESGIAGLTHQMVEDAYDAFEVYPGALLRNRKDNLIRKTSRLTWNKRVGILLANNRLSTISE